MRNIQIELILLTIAEGLQSISKDPDLSAKIKEAYALTEEEKAKAEEARTVIANAASFLADINTQKMALGDINAQIAEAKKLEADNAEILKAIASDKRDLEIRIKALEEQESVFEERSLVLDQREEKLKDKEEALASSQQELNVAKADFQKRIDILKSQAEGM